MGTLNGTAESYVFSIGRSAVTNGARLHVERPGGIATYGELTDRLGRCLQRLGLKNLKRQPACKCDRFAAVRRGGAYRHHWLVGGALALGAIATKLTSGIDQGLRLAPPFLAFAAVAIAR